MTSVIGMTFFFALAGAAFLGAATGFDQGWMFVGSLIGVATSSALTAYNM